jgi:hypothetical protein
MMRTSGARACPPFLPEGAGGTPGHDHMAYGLSRCFGQG